MNYQNKTTLDVVSYYTLKNTIYKDRGVPKDGITEIWDYHVITPVAKPAYDVYTQTCTEIAPVAYVQTWSVVDMTQPEIDAYDVNLRVQYEESMNRDMITAQIDALGDPAVHRYTQGMTRYTSLIGKIVSGGTPTTEELAYMDGAEVGLEYQEVNALNFAGAVASIGSLSGQDILDYPQPNFTMNPATQTGYQPYKDYLANGFPD